MKLFLVLPGLTDMTALGSLESGSVGAAYGRPGAELPEFRTPPTRPTWETGCEVGWRSGEVVVAEVKDPRSRQVRDLWRERASGGACAGPRGGRLYI